MSCAQNIVTSCRTQRHVDDSPIFNFGVQPMTILGEPSPGYLQISGLGSISHGSVELSEQSPSMASDQTSTNMSYCAPSSLAPKSRHDGNSPPRARTLCRFCCRSGKPCDDGNTVERCARCEGKDRLCKESIRKPASLRASFWVHFAQRALAQYADMALVTNWEGVSQQTIQISCQASDNSSNKTPTSKSIDTVVLRMDDLRSPVRNGDGSLRIASTLANALGWASAEVTSARDTSSRDGKRLLAKLQVCIPPLHSQALTHLHSITGSNMMPALASYVNRLNAQSAP